MNSSNTGNRISTVFTLPLVAGILILVGSFFPLLFFIGSPWNYMNGMHGMMGNGGFGGYGSGMMRFGYGPGFMSGWWFFYRPVVSGIIVLIGAIMLKKNPKNTQSWAILVIIFSVIGLLGMGYSILGGVLGIIGGSIALERNRRINA